MDATRARPWFVDAPSSRTRLSLESEPISEYFRWVAAAALVAAAIVVVALVVRELRFPPSYDVVADTSSSTVLPAEMVSVPTLVLAQGHQVRVGESRVDAIAQLAALKLLKRTEERGPLGAREVRSYQGVTLVFEPFERAGDSRVAGIYLQ